METPLLDRLESQVKEIKLFLSVLNDSRPLSPESREMSFLFDLSGSIFAGTYKRAHWTVIKLDSFTGRDGDCLPDLEKLEIEIENKALSLVALAQIEGFRGKVRRIIKAVDEAQEQIETLKTDKAALIPNFEKLWSLYNERQDQIQAEAFAITEPVRQQVAQLQLNAMGALPIAIQLLKTLEMSFLPYYSLKLDAAINAALPAIHANPPPETPADINTPDVEDWMNQSSQFNENITGRELFNFFARLHTVKKKNGETFLKEQQTKGFIQKAFFEQHDIKPIYLNIGAGEQGLVIALFFGFKEYCYKKGYEPSKRNVNPKYVSVLVNNFKAFGEKRNYVSKNFNNSYDSKNKKFWDL